MSSHHKYGNELYVFKDIKSQKVCFKKFETYDSLMIEYIYFQEKYFIYVI